jgi:hypothetical protein
MPIVVVSIVSFTCQGRAKVGEDRKCMWEAEACRALEIGFGLLRIDSEECRRVGGMILRPHITDAKLRSERVINCLLHLC